MASMHSQFKLFSVFFKEMIAKSPKFPKIDYDTISNFVFNHHESKDGADMNLAIPESEVLSRASIELSYVKATRTQKTRGLSGKLCRAELFDLLIRLVHQIFAKKIVAGFDVFVQKFIEPVFLSS